MRYLLCKSNWIKYRLQLLPKINCSMLCTRLTATEPKWGSHACGIYIQFSTGNTERQTPIKAINWLPEVDEHVLLTGPCNSCTPWRCHPWISSLLWNSPNMPKFPQGKFAPLLWLSNPDVYSYTELIVCRQRTYVDGDSSSSLAWE